jgi:hypothetical protein
MKSRRELSSTSTIFGGVFRIPLSIDASVLTLLFNMKQSCPIWLGHRSLPDKGDSPSIYDQVRLA